MNIKPEEIEIQPVKVYYLKMQAPSERYIEEDKAILYERKEFSPQNFWEKIKDKLGLEKSIEIRLTDEVQQYLKG